MNTKKEAFMFPARFLRLCARESQLQENDLPEILQGTDLPPQVLLPGEEVDILIKHLETIYANLQQIRTVDDMGLRIGKNLKAQIIGPIGHLLLSAPTLVSALKAPAEFQALRVLFVETKLDFDKTHLYCYLNLHVAFSPAIQRLMLESFAITMQTYMETVLGRPLTEASFFFTFDQPDYYSRYDDYLHSPCHFSQNDNLIKIPIELANHPNMSRSKDSYVFAQQECQKLLSSMPMKSLSIADRVTRVLLSQPLGSLSEEEVAKSLYVSKRTLARRLDEMNTSFRVIRDQLLASLAAKYLSDERLSVDATAALLGYQDSSNFRRAFKRWYSISPSAYRQHTTS